MATATALLVLIAASLVLLGVTMAMFAPRFADTIVSVAATATAVDPATAPNRVSRRVAAADAAAKELLLLRRDPWLVSQSLMQLLYLVPPALMLWRSFSEARRRSS